MGGMNPTIPNDPMDRSSILSSPDSTQGRRKHVCSSVSLSRNRGLGKGTAFESPSPANSVESLSSFSLFGANPKVRHFIIRRFSVCRVYSRLADNNLQDLDSPYWLHSSAYSHVAHPPAH